MKSKNLQWKKLQIDALKRVLSIVDEVSEVRPADSESEEEEEIWDTINYLKSILECFFDNKKRSDI